MKHLKVLSVLFLLIFAFASCKKDDTTTTTTTTSKIDLIAKTWQVQKVAGKVSGVELLFYEKGKTGNLLDFSKYRLTLTKDGKYTEINEDGNNTSGVWKFTENETKIVINAGTASERTFTIAQLTSANFDFPSKIIDQGQEIPLTFYMIPA